MLYLDPDLVNFWKSLWIRLSAKCCECEGDPFSWILDMSFYCQAGKQYASSLNDVHPLRSGDFPPITQIKKKINSFQVTKSKLCWGYAVSQTVVAVRVCLIEGHTYWPKHKNRLTCNPTVCPPPSTHSPTTSDPCTISSLITLTSFVYLLSCSFFLSLADSGQKNKEPS